MKIVHATSLAAALAVFAGSAMASAVLVNSNPRVMPVLVQVNAHGHVTSVRPSTPLEPRFQRLLAKTLGEWITRPAYIKGHAVDSQLIIDVSMKVTPRADHKYDASFAYVSSGPAPFGGAAHWVSKNGNQLALVSNAGALDFDRREAAPVYNDNVQYPETSTATTPAPRPAVASMAAQTPPPSTTRSGH